MLVGHFLVLETRDLFNHSRQCGVSIKSRIETMSYREIPYCHRTLTQKIDA